MALHAREWLSGKKKHFESVVMLREYTEIKNNRHFEMLYSKNHHPTVVQQKKKGWRRNISYYVYTVQRITIAFFAAQLFEL